MSPLIVKVPTRLTAYLINTNDTSIKPLLQVAFFPPSPSFLSHMSLDNLTITALTRYFQAPIKQPGGSYAPLIYDYAITIIRQGYRHPR